MSGKKPAISEIDDAVKLYFQEKIDAVVPAPPPSLAGGEAKRSAALRTALPRAAAAVLLVACGAFLFIRPVKQNTLAERISYAAEESDLEKKVVSGLQRSGRFISNSLEIRKQGVNQ